MKYNLFKLYRATVIFVLMCAGFWAQAQLDNVHYVPPMKQAVPSVGNAAERGNEIHLSTPVTTPFDVEVYYGNSTTPDTILTGLENSNPLVLELARPFDGIVQLDDAQTGVVLDSAGIRFESSGSEFYVNYRIRSGNQADLYTAKGQNALGTNFRWGGIPNIGTNAAINSSLGIYAIEDGTTVIVSGYDTASVFRKELDPAGITDNVLTISLDAGESYVLEAITSEGSGSVNLDGWLGASIISDKPIALSNGQLVMSSDLTLSGADAGMDQPVPASILGTYYVLIRGNGSDETEYGIVVATQDSTIISAGGVVLDTINDGEYYRVTGDNYSSTTAGANMLIETSKSVYVYQNTAGRPGAGNDGPTVGMNFIPTATCLNEYSVDLISDIEDVAGQTSVSSAVTIVGYTSSFLGSAGETITIEHDGGTINLTEVDGTSVDGSSGDNITYYQDSLTGDVTVSSSGPIAVGVFGQLGSISGFAGYFSGFDEVPEITLTSGEQCVSPSNPATFELTGFDGYQWRINGQDIDSETNSTFSATEGGAYTVEVLQGSCPATSGVLELYDIPVSSLVSDDDDNIITFGDPITFTASGGDEYEFSIEGIVVQTRSADSTYTTDTLKDGQ